MQFLEIKYANLKKLYRRVFPPEKKYLKDLKLFDGCGKILDLGCGNGYFISLDTKRICGLEANPLLVKNLHKRGFKVIEGDIRTLPFEADSFDGAYCSHIIEHFTYKDVIRIFSEVYRILKPKGIFVIKTPFPSLRFWNDITHIRPYPPGALTMLVRSQEEGYQTVIKGMTSFQFIIIRIYLERHNPIIPTPKIPVEINRKINYWRLSQRILSAGCEKLHLYLPRPTSYTLVLQKEESKDRKTDFSY